MKLFDKYFQPYAEYCLRTTLSEEELKEALAQGSFVCHLVGNIPFCVFYRTCFHRLRVLPSYGDG